MKLAELQRTATLSWSPLIGKNQFLATGTVAGALDASFSISTELEIFECNFDGKKDSALNRKAFASTNSRFHRLSWSPSGAGSYGSIAGGLDNGTLEVWNVAALFNNQSNEKSSVMHYEGHKGAVKGLEFNPKQANVLASGSAEGDIFIWDLNSPGKPYAPGPKSQKVDEVTDLAWNRVVPHILATASNTAYTVIWDLKNKREVIQIPNPYGRKTITAVAWNPDSPTQIVTAADDDSNPVVLSWDLRNAHAPEKILSGHAKGILSLAWCPKDSEILLSSGKDHRTICWNPKTGSMLGQIPPSDNWTFDVSWCTKNPDLIATGSFDGKVSVYSFQNLASSKNQPQALPSPSAINDPFAPPVHVEEYSIKQTPKWLKRPCGATFAFGGKLVSFSSKDFSVHLRRAIGPSHAQNHLINSCLSLEQGIKTGDFNFFFQEKEAEISSGNEMEYLMWKLIRTLTLREPRSNVLEALGFSKESLEASLINLQVKDVSLRPNISSSEVNNELQLESEETEKSSDFDQVSSQSLSPFSLSGLDSETPCELITRALIMGDLKSAANLCVKEEKYSDALIIANCHSPEFYSQVQAHILNVSESAYMKLISGIVRGSLNSFVASIDLNNWKEALGAICSYANDADFTSHTLQLGLRLETEMKANYSADKKFACALCFFASGELARVSSVFLETATSDEFSDSNWLASFAQKLTVIKQSLPNESGSSFSVDDKLAELLYTFSQQLVASGSILSEIALMYLDWIDLELLKDENLVSKIKSWKERLLISCGKVEEVRRSSFGKLKSIANDIPPTVNTRSSFSKPSQQQTSPNVLQPTTKMPYSTPNNPYAVSPQIQQSQASLQPGYPQHQHQQPQQQQQQQPFAYPQSGFTNQNISSYIGGTFDQSLQYQQRAQSGLSQENAFIPKPAAPIASPPPQLNKPSIPTSTKAYNDIPFSVTSNQRPPPAIRPAKPIMPATVQPQQPRNIPVAASEKSISSVQSSLNAPFPQAHSVTGNMQQHQQQRHPPGDRSHIPPNYLPIVKSFSALLSKVSSNAASVPGQKKIIDDCDRRLNIFYDKLNNGELSQPVLTQCLELAKAISSGDYNTAQSYQISLLTAGAFEEVGSWNMAIKRLLELARSLQI